MHQLIEKSVTFGEDADGLFIKHSQEIPRSFLDSLRVQREDSLSTPSGDFCRVASIPEVLADKWKKEGFDIMVEPIRDILARLRREQFDAFITTKKRV